MKTLESKYTLNIAATPIGNLQEVNKRFLDTIVNMDILLCEDTRVIKKLLMLLDIKKNFQYVKFDQFSELNQTQDVIDWIKSGKQVILLSDAGYPTISDPGYKLVYMCIQENIAINVINGPCSLIHGLVGSGFSSREFLFLGFLGKTSNERVKKINSYKHVNLTWVILESMHRIQECLVDLYNCLGNQRICIARELTKIHEEFVYCKLSEVSKLALNWKGEFIIIVDNKQSTTIVTKEIIDIDILELLKEGYKTKDISIIIANKYHLDAKNLYHQIIDFKNKISK